ncbi:MAG: hypothetical protein QM784_32685 [Polyangiaceae bacterium]
MTTASNPWHRRVNEQDVWWRLEEVSQTTDDALRKIDAQLRLPHFQRLDENLHFVTWTHDEEQSSGFSVGPQLGHVVSAKEFNQSLLFDSPVPTGSPMRRQPAAVDPRKHGGRAGSDQSSNLMGGEIGSARNQLAVRRVNEGALAMGFFLAIIR